MYTYFHSVSTSRLFTSVTFSKGPVQGVSERVLLQVAEDLLLDFESGVVCYLMSVYLPYCLSKLYVRDAAMASEEKDSMTVGS